MRGSALGGGLGVGGGGGLYSPLSGLMDQRLVLRRKMRSERTITMEAASREEIQWISNMIYKKQTDSVKTYCRLSQHRVEWSARATYRRIVQPKAEGVEIIS